MAKQSKKSKDDSSSMYQDFISAPRVEKSGKEAKNWYIKFCRQSGKIIKGPAVFKKPAYKTALDFLGWDLKPSEVNAAPVLAMLIGLVVSLPVLFYMIYSVFIIKTLPFTVLTYVAPFCLLIPFMLSFFIQGYPISQAKMQKMRSMTYIPEIINYLVMSMKLSPNLETAVEFAAEHGSGKIAEDLKDILWKTRIGEYRTIEEGLDVLAYTWGNFSEEFKHSLMLVRSSVIEVDESKRHLILDKAVTDVLEGIKDNMNAYAGEMRQPSVYLYYLGVLLPLMMIIMLPIGAMMAKIPIAQTWILILIYNIFIPVLTVVFANTILQRRPPVYNPPQIPDDYPGLPKKNFMKIGKTSMPTVVFAVLAFVGIYLSFTYLIDPMINPMPPVYDADALANYFPFFQLAGVIIGISTAMSVYLYGSSFAKRKVQREIMEMENEFQDSIYIIASRLGENRPMEEAMEYTSNFIGMSRISTIYQTTVANIKNMGMTVETALFDPVYGSLKNVPSTVIRGAMRIVVDSIGLGVQQGARALISLSLQMRDSQKIKQRIAELLSEITSMMKSIAFVIAPLVLGITSALQKIVVNALKAAGTTNVATSIPNVPGLPDMMRGGSMMGLGDPKMLETIPDSITFLLIIALFVIEVTVILIFFTTKIEEGKNNLALKINLAKGLPLAMLLFFISAFFAANMVTIS